MCPWISNFFSSFLFSFANLEDWVRVAKVSISMASASFEAGLLPIAANYHNPKVTCTSTVADSGILMDG